MRQGLSQRWMAWMLLGTTVLGTSFLGPGSASAQMLDEPDLQKEQRLHQIYQRYYSAPTSPEKWNQALSQSKNQTYQIQKGDTLWDISQTLFGDPNFWPKIWSLNSGIYNPHEIVPQNSVEFSPGAGAEPPALGVIAGSGPTVDLTGDSEEVAAVEEEVEETPIVTEPTVGQYIDIDLSQVTIPKAKRRSKKPAALPASLPSYIYHRDPVKDAVLEVTPIRRDTSMAPMLVSHFVTDSKLVGAGEVLGTELGFHTAGEGQEILVKTKAFTTGNRVMALKEQGKIPGTDKTLAYAVHGELELKDVVNSGEGIYRALVVRSLALIEAGDMLILEQIPKVMPQTTTSSMSPVAGKIIGGQFSKRRELFAPYNIVYLNAGEGQGLSVGAHVPVYRNPLVRDSDTIIRENPQEIGELQIVRVSGGVATAVVVRQLDDIRVGDVTSPGLQ